MRHKDEPSAGELIATARARAGLSQRELARRSHTSAAAICQYEAGQRTPRVDTLHRIVAAAGASLHVQLRWPEPAGIDVHRNARILEDLLDLADHLPRHASKTLRFPALAARAR